MRVAAITPYYKEPRAFLDRCMASVRKQTVPTEQIMIADGHPQDWIDGVPVRHLKLDSEHGDYGNTPRGIGALMAIAERYDAITFLDADNWWEPNHVAECLAAAAKVPDCDYVIAKRFMRRPDGSLLPHGETLAHVDTNCYFFLPGSYSVVPRWAMIPHGLAWIGDNVFWQMLQREPFVRAVTYNATINYLCLYEMTYRARGETPPEGVKPMRDTGAEVSAWLETLTPREHAVESRLAGIDLQIQKRETP